MTQTYLRAPEKIPATKSPGRPRHSPSMSMTKSGKSWSPLDTIPERMGSQSQYLAYTTIPPKAQVIIRMKRPTRLIQRALIAICFVCTLKYRCTCVVKQYYETLINMPQFAMCFSLLLLQSINIHCEGHHYHLLCHDNYLPVPG